MRPLLVTSRSGANSHPASRCGRTIGGRFVRANTGCEAHDVTSTGWVQGLPVPLTPLIGREREWRPCVPCCDADDIRLVTLIGPAGSARRASPWRSPRRLRTISPTACVSCRSARSSDASLVGPAIAQALGVREAGDRPLVDQLAEFLRHSEVLLLLDSVERAAEDASFLTGLLCRVSRPEAHGHQPLGAAPYRRASLSGPAVGDSWPGCWRLTGS